MRLRHNRAWKLWPACKGTAFVKIHERTSLLTRMCSWVPASETWQARLCMEETEVGVGLEVTSG